MEPTDAGPARLSFADLKRRAEERRQAAGAGGRRTPHPEGWHAARFVDVLQVPAERSRYGKPQLLWVLATGRQADGSLRLAMKFTSEAISEPWTAEDGAAMDASGHYTLLAEVTGLAGLSEAEIEAWGYTPALLIGRPCRAAVEALPDGKARVIGFAPPEPGDAAAAPALADYKRPAGITKLAGVPAAPQAAAAGARRNPFGAAPAAAQAPEEAPPEFVDLPPEFDDGAAAAAGPPMSKPKKTAAEIAAEQAERAAGKGWSKPRPPGACPVCGGTGRLPASGEPCPTCGGAAEEPL